MIKKYSFMLMIFLLFVLMALMNTATISQDNSNLNQTITRQKFELKNKEEKENVYSDKDLEIQEYVEIFVDTKKEGVDPQ